MSEASMRAVEITEIGKSEIIEMRRPNPGPGEVQIRILANGICGSDVAAYLGKHPYRVPPVITGHEPVGEVSALGPGVTGIHLGNTVVVEPHIGCGDCAECRSGRYNICRRKRVLGTPSWSGSFAEYITAPVQCVNRIDHILSLDEAVLIEPLSVATHSVRVARLQGGERVAVLGCGPIGLMHVLAASQYSPQELVCCDIKDANLKIAERIGGTACLNSMHIDVVREVNTLTDGRGLDVSFVVFHSSELVQMAISMAKPGGTIILVANFPDPLDVSFQRVQLAELRLMGTAMYTHEDYAASIANARGFGERLTSLITHRIGLSEVPGYLRMLGSGALETAVKVVIEMH